MPPRRGHRGRLPVGGRPPLLAPPHRRGPHHAGRGRRDDDPARCWGPACCSCPCGPSSVVAKQATALQLLSGGRFVLGLGVGIHEPEYVRAGVDYHRRGRLMDEGVAGLRRAWAGPDAGGADYVQEPASAPVPLWFGGSSDAARRRAAAVGDGWVPLFLAPDEYGPALAAAAARDGRGRPRSRGRAGRASSSLPASVTTTRRPSRAPSGSRSSTACRPRRSTATWWPARPRPVPPPSTATPRPGPATSS